MAHVRRSLPASSVAALVLFSTLAFFSSKTAVAAPMPRPQDPTSVTVVSETVDGLKFNPGADINTKLPIKARSAGGRGTVGEILKYGPFNDPAKHNVRLWVVYSDGSNGFVAAPATDVNQDWPVVDWVPGFDSDPRVYMNPATEDSSEPLDDCFKSVRSSGLTPATTGMKGGVVGVLVKRPTTGGPLLMYAYAAAALLVGLALGWWGGRRAASRA